MKKVLDTFIRSLSSVPKRSRTYFEVSIGEEDAGRIEFELFDDVCPVTCENFLELCKGHEVGGYEGSVFHRVIKGFVVQGGDFTNFNGTGGVSIYGERFDDENFDLPHEEFVLSMANAGPNTNGSQFFITCVPLDFLDGKHTVFGKVANEESIKVVQKIENVDVGDQDRPVLDCMITECGEITDDL